LDEKEKSLFEAINPDGSFQGGGGGEFQLRF